MEITIVSKWLKRRRRRERNCGGLDRSMLFTLLAASYKQGALTMLAVMIIMVPYQCVALSHHCF